MSNPGVIKLAKEQYENHKIWLDDNIGESIHLHIDQMRIDFSVNEFSIFCKELRVVLNNLVNIEGFDANVWDARFMKQISDKLQYIDRIVYDEVDVGNLRVNQDGSFCYINESARVNALNGNINIDATPQRKSNYLGQCNSERLTSCLKYIKKNGYPCEDNYIVLFEGTNIILDGWHRAACLFHLYGNIKVLVKRIYFKSGKSGNNDGTLFLFDRIPEGSKIVLWGAGFIGRLYYEQIMSNKKLELIGWVDKKYDEIGELYGYNISSTKEVKQMEFDYIIIATNTSASIAKIHETLLNFGINEAKIIVF